ncbi:MAG: Lysine 2,3-aminomutase [Chlamydiota bacterium]|jgi:EF-P beta-lysylation protein EpmB
MWKQTLRKNFTSWEKLASFLNIDPSSILKKTPFSLNLPLRLAEKIEKGRLDDPILLQFLPSTQELNTSPLFSRDPVSDASFRTAPKLLHKYQGRALILVSSACAMHCRYCFRRHFPYETEVKGFESELNEVASDLTLSEIILSGGDPLSLSNETLSSLFKQIDLIPHIKRIRFHTRFPVGIPERIDDSFLTLLRNSNKQILFIIHINHPKECDDTLFAYLKEIQKLGIPILSQSVLLNKVNDDLDTLETLCLTLIDHGILPYYLHQLDRVDGAAHFEVTEEKGRSLILELRKRLPGYAVPQYVKEEAHAPHKTPL